MFPRMVARGCAQRPIGSRAKKEPKIWLNPKNPRRLAVPEGVEPPTFGLGNRCSIRLSYGTALISQANLSWGSNFALILLRDRKPIGSGAERSTQSQKLSVGSSRTQMGYRLPES